MRVCYDVDIWARVVD